MFIKEQMYQLFPWGMKMTRMRSDNLLMPELLTHMMLTGGFKDTRCRIDILL